MIQTLRENIWKASKNDITVIERAKTGIRLQPGTVLFYEALLRRVEELMKPKRTKRVPTDQTTQASKDRYRQAKWDYESGKFKPWVQDGHFIEPEYPNCATSNGLTDWVMQYVTWTGGRATRISSAGRQLPGGKFIPSTTRKGSADVSSTIKIGGIGKSVMWEIKAGSDKPSPNQFKEQDKERRAGGEYFFVSSAEQFFLQFDSLFVVNNKLF